MNFSQELASKSNTPLAYENARVAVDMVALAYLESQLCVCLHVRERDPFQGNLELPGGLLLTGESAEETVIRKISPVVHNIQPDSVHQFFTFSDPKRDPRMRTVTIGYLACVRAASITQKELWYPITQVTELAFDHSAILAKALNHLARLDVSNLKWLLPERFRLNELHDLCLIIYGDSGKVSADNRNFRRDMIKSGLIVPTDEVESSVQHRPAKLYRFSATTTYA